MRNFQDYEALSLERRCLAAEEALAALRASLPLLKEDGEGGVGRGRQGHGFGHELDLSLGQLVHRVKGRSFEGAGGR